jgi:hypothetical protein
MKTFFYLKKRKLKDIKKVSKNEDEKSIDRRDKSGEKCAAAKKFFLMDTQRKIPILFTLHRVKANGTRMRKARRFSV